MWINFKVLPTYLYNELILLNVVRKMVLTQKLFTLIVCGKIYIDIIY